MSGVQRFGRQLSREVMRGETPMVPIPGISGHHIDTITWGESVNFGTQADAGSAVAITFPSAQVCKALYPSPLVWAVKILAEITRPAGETASFVINLVIMAGVGMTTARLPRTLTSAKTGSLETLEITESFIPAQSINIDASGLLGATGAIAAGIHTTKITAIVAPYGYS